MDHTDKAYTLHPASPIASHSSHTSTESNGSHSYRYQLKSVAAMDEDFSQDRAQNAFSIDEIPWEFPLFHLRYNRVRHRKEFEERMRHDYVPTDIPPWAERVRRFDPRFIELVPPEDTRFEQSLQDTAKWLQGRPSALKNFLMMHRERSLPIEAHSFAGVRSSGESPDEEDVAVACAALVEAVTEELISCLATSFKHSREDPSNKSAQEMALPLAQEQNMTPPDNRTRGTKRRREDRKDETPRLVPDEATVLFKFGLDGTDHEAYAPVNGGQDMTIDSVLRYALYTATNEAIVGRLTICAIQATWMRFWIIDPLSFATTRAWDLANPVHAYEVVRMIGFLIGPIQDVFQTWKPPLEGFITRLPVPQADKSPDEAEKARSKPPGDQGVTQDDAKMAADPADGAIHDKRSLTRSGRGHEHVETKHWEWAGKNYKELWQSKHLFGRRTTLWERKVRQVGALKAAELEAIATAHDDLAAQQTALDCVIKATFLPPGLLEHEHEMLMRLDPAVPLPENSEFAKLDAEIKDEVFQNLPRSLGLMNLGESSLRSTRKLPATAHADGLPRPNLTHLELVVLVMQGPTGERLHPWSQGLTLADVCEIHQGPFLQAWYGAEQGVHFRDVSPGNILWKPGPDDRKVGFMVDYGNARFENERRDKSASADTGDGDCEDDLRSGTQQSLCVSVLDASKAIEKCRKQELAIAARKGHRALDLLDQKQLERHKRDVLINRHRYIDDIESILYNLLHYASHAVDVPEEAAIEVDKFLSEAESKRTEWESSLFNISKTLSNERFTAMVSDLADLIRLARVDIEDIMANPDAPKRLTEAELLSYPELWEILRTGCEDLRAQQIEKDAAASSA